MAFPSSHGPQMPWGSQIFAGTGILMSVVAELYHRARQRVIERKLQEVKDRRASQDDYRMLFESIPQMIFTKNLNSVYLTCNQNYARSLGIKPEELTGHTDYDYYPKDLADRYRADDRRIIESGLPETLEERHVQSGNEAWIHVVKAPIRNEDGKVCGVLGISRRLRKFSGGARRRQSAGISTISSAQRLRFP